MNPNPSQQHQSAEPPPPASAGPLPDEALEATETKLSAEEQMARFEEALKESDWGHQPC